MADADHRPRPPSPSCRHAAGADFVGELIDTFLEEAPPMLAELRDALGGGRRRGASAAPRIR